MTVLCNINEAPENRNVNRVTVTLKSWVHRFIPSKEGNSRIRLKLIKEPRFIHGNDWANSNGLSKFCTPPEGYFLT